MNPELPEAKAGSMRPPEPGAEAARPEESLLRETLAASPFGILVHDAAGKILFFNARLEQFTGLAASEVPDIPTWLRLVYPNPEYRRIIIAKPRHEVSPGSVRTRESMITLRDGRTQMYRFNSVRRESGLRVVFIQPAEDPDAFAAALAESEYNYRHLYQRSLLPTLLWVRREKSFHLVNFNAAARGLLGDALAPALGRPGAALFPACPEFVERLDRCLVDGKTTPAEFWTGGLAGETGSFLRLTFACAAPALAMVCVEDLTPVKHAQAEARLEESRMQDKEERLRLAVEASQVGIYETDLETGTRQWSAEMYAITGLKPEAALTDEAAWGIVHPEDLDAALDTHRKGLDPQGDGLFFSEHRIVRPDGAVRWIAWRGRTYFRDAPSGRVPTHRRGTCVDITERKRAEEKLSRVNQELEERVRRRTAALEELNASLRREISARAAAEEELKARTEELAEINNALRVVLRKSRETQEETARKMAAQIRQLALPHLEKLKLARLNGRQAAYVQLLDEALAQIASREVSSLGELQRRLTPNEYQVAVLIRKGLRSKQVAEIMSLSCRTIESHRKSIRKKLDLRHSKSNLSSHLASIAEQNPPPDIG